MTRFCSSCGKEVADDTKFCPSCGKPISVVAELTQPKKEILKAETPTDEYTAKQNFGLILAVIGSVVAFGGQIVFAGQSLNSSISRIMADSLGLLMLLVGIIIIIYYTVRIHSQKNPNS